MVSVDILKHVLVPKHEVLSNEDKKALLEKLGIEVVKLPKVFLNDPVIKHIKAKIGDVVKITRESPTAGTAIYYRVVVEG